MCVGACVVLVCVVVPMLSRVCPFVGACVWVSVLVLVLARVCVCWCVCG